MCHDGENSRRPTSCDETRSTPSPRNGVPTNLQRGQKRMLASRKCKSEMGSPALSDRTAGNASPTSKASSLPPRRDSARSLSSSPTEPSDSMKDDCSSLHINTVRRLPVEEVKRKWRDHQISEQQKLLKAQRGLWCWRLLKPFLRARSC